MPNGDGGLNDYILILVVFWVRLPFYFTVFDFVD